LGPLGKRGGIGAGIMRIMKGVPGFARDDGCGVLHPSLQSIAHLLYTVEAVLEGPVGFFHAGWRHQLLLIGPEFEPLPVPGESDAENWDGKCEEEKKGRRQTWAKSG